MDLDRRYTVMESLPEDVQDQSQPIVVVGTDVVNLYPSLDIGKVVDIVKDAVLQSRVSWEEMDYLEASRYIALNWTKEQCDGSKLRRLLPTRRYATGSRPGLTGAGPQGAMRGDQEQWSNLPLRRCSRITIMVLMGKSSDKGKGVLSG